MTTQLKLEWEKQTLDRFNLMIEKIPLFHRNIARIVAVKRAEINAQERGSGLVQESDVVKAFFKEVPMAFYSLMIRLLDEVGFDYKKHEPK